MNRLRTLAAVTGAVVGLSITTAIAGLLLWNLIALLAPPVAAKLSQVEHLGELALAVALAAGAAYILKTLFG